MQLDDSLRLWLVERVRSEPEYFGTKILPAWQELVNRSHSDFHQTARVGDPAKITYSQGRLDGVQMFLELLGGLKTAETPKPVETGLMSRMKGLARKF